MANMTPGIHWADDDADGIATVTLSNPGKLNAINGDMWRQLGRVMGELSARDDLRCIIIRGEGEVFAAGGDIEEFRTARATVARFQADKAADGKRTRVPFAVTHEALAKVAGDLAG